jgi:lipopolysaccharide transport system permease protein
MTDPRNRQPRAAPHSFSYIRDGVETAHFPKGPVEFLISPLRHHQVLAQLIRRDIASQYRGSALGLLWPIVHPLVMLVAYTFVFGVVLNARWAGTRSGPEFSIVLFVGLIVFSLLAECINRAPQLIVERPNFVKKIVFPLELLPWMTLASALFHALISTAIWCVFYFVMYGTLHRTSIFFLLLLIPTGLLGLGVGYLLSAAGVYARDVGQIVVPATQLLMFLSPVFYSTAVVPPSLQSLLAANPLTFLIEQARAILLNGATPDWTGLAAITIVAAVFAAAAFAWFQHLREGFADVV